MSMNIGAWNLLEIGAWQTSENEPPICWKFLARYKNSKRIFSLRGCGEFPKKIFAPKNIDSRTAKLYDNGLEIGKEQYKIIWR